MGSNALPILIFAWGATAAAQEVPAPPPSPEVHIRRLRIPGDNRGLELRRRLGNEWEKVCTWPCYEPVIPEGELRVQGAGIVPSEPFTLLPGTEVAIDVDPANGSTQGLLTASTVSGGVSTLVGLLLIGLGQPHLERPWLCLFPPCEPQAIPANDTLINGGIVTMAMGLALAITSGILLQRLRTVVTVAVTRPPAPLVP